MKITLEMVSQIYEVKLTSYSLDKNDFVVGQIVNEKNYQHELKVARIANIYYEVKENQESTLSLSHAKSSNSANLF